MSLFCSRSVYAKAFSALLIASCATLASVQVNANQKSIALLEVPVDKRVNFDFIPEGIAYNGFIIHPILELSTEYNDNIFASQDNEISDTAFIAAPGISIDKKYGAHSFDLSANMNIKKFAEQTDEDQAAYRLNTSGFLGFGNLTSAFYSLGHQRTYLTRENPGNSRISEEPISQFTTEGEIGLFRKFNRLNVTVLGNVARKTFEDDIAKNTGTALTFSDRDRNIYTASVKLGYEILGDDIRQPEHIIFTEFSHQKNVFDGVGAAGLSPDNQQTGALAGILTNYKGILFGKVALGYFEQEFENSKDIGRVDIEANLAYNITPKTTLSFQGLRDVLQDNSFVAGYVDTEFRLGVDHELLHDTYIGALHTYNEREFLGDLSGREDEVHSSEIYLRRNINRNLEGRLQFTHKFQDSNQPNTDYDQNKVLFSLIGRL